MTEIGQGVTRNEMPDIERPIKLSYNTEMASLVKRAQHQVFLRRHRFHSDRANRYLPSVLKCHRVY